VLGRHWGGVQEGLHAVHPVREVEGVMKGAPRDGNGDGESALPSLVGKAQMSSANADEQQQRDALADSSDSEGEGGIESHPKTPSTTASSSEVEKRLALARRVARKWWRLAGLKGHPGLCEDGAAEDFTVPWTKGVAPRVEGRIVCLGGDGSSSSTS